MKTVTIQELQEILTGQDGTVLLDEDYSVRPEPNTKLILGWKHSLNLFALFKPELTIDGRGHRLDIYIEDTVQTDTALFEIPVGARGVHIRNWHISFLYGGAACSRTIYAFRNLARNVRMTDCRITMNTRSQIHMTAFFNQGAIDTTLESGADELVIEGCTFRLYNGAQSFEWPQTYYGLYNDLANSICFTNNYLFIQNKGTGEAQQAIAVYNSGRYARMANNNIKANGSHNVGKQLENCFATGLLNRGDYLLLSDNNIVGEWGGQCLGVVNYGNYVKIHGNKILATHTIHGCSIRQYGARGVLSGNIITSTSRNPRVVEIYADCNLLENNVVDALLRNECYSGCCVRAVGSETRFLRNVLVKGNVLSGGVDAGVCLSRCENCSVTDNAIEGVPQRAHFVPVLDSGRCNAVRDNLLDDWLQPDEAAAEANLDDGKIGSVYE